MEENSEVPMETDVPSITSSTLDSHQVTGLHGNVETVILVEEVKEEDVFDINCAPTSSPIKHKDVQRSAFSPKLLPDNVQPKKITASPAMGQVVMNPEVPMETDVPSITSSTLDSHQVTGLHGNVETVILVEEVKEADVFDINCAVCEDVGSSPIKLKDVQRSAFSPKLLPDNVQPKKITASPAMGQVVMNPQKSMAEVNNSKPTESKQGPDTLKNIENVEKAATKLDQVQRAPIKLIRMYRNPSKIQVIDKSTLQAQKSLSTTDQVPKKLDQVPNTPSEGEQESKKMDQIQKSSSKTEQLMSKKLDHVPNTQSAVEQEPRKMVQIQKSLSKTEHISKKLDHVPNIQPAVEQGPKKMDQTQKSSSKTEQISMKLDHVPNTKSAVEQSPKKMDQMQTSSRTDQAPKKLDQAPNTPTVVEQVSKKMDQVQKKPSAKDQESNMLDQGQKTQIGTKQVPNKGDQVQKTLTIPKVVQNTLRKDPNIPPKSAQAEKILTLDGQKKLDQFQTILVQNAPGAIPVKPLQQAMVITPNEIPTNRSDKTDAVLEKSTKEMGHQSTKESIGKSDLVNKFESKSNKFVSQSDTQLNKSVIQSVPQLNTPVNKSESLLNKSVRESELQLNKSGNKSQLSGSKPESESDTSVSKTDSQSNKFESQNKSITTAEPQLNKSVLTLKPSGLNSKNLIDEEQNSVRDGSENADQISVGSLSTEINEDKSVQNRDEVVAKSSMDICEQSNESQVETNSDISEKEHNRGISRELKSLIKSAKESKIISECTQLTSKTRKSKSAADSTNTSLNTTAEIEKKSVRRSRSRSSEKSTKSPSKRSMRSQNPEFVNKVKLFLNSVTGKNQKEDELGESTKEGQTESKSPSAKKMKLTESSELAHQLLNRLRSDPYCWRCHWPLEQVANDKGHPPLPCTVCPRSFHFKCLSPSERNKTSDEKSWICPECLIVLYAESSETRSPAMKKISLGLLCELLQHALNRMMELNGAEPFMYPVDRTAYPDYDKFVVHPMDLSLMKKNISEGLYGSTEAFLVDAQWILHNSIIFNSSTSMMQNKLSAVARALVRTCRAEMGEIEACPECYAAAHARRPTWFTDVCSTPHILLWAKLKGFPYWPAKAMSVNSQGLVDVRFFGAHDRAWVPARDCFLFCEKDPNNFKVKRQDMLESMQEAENHISNISRKYGKFVYPAFKTPFDPTKLTEQRKIMIPAFEGEVVVKTQVKEKPVTPNKMNKLSSKRSINEGDASAIEESSMNKTNDRSRRSRSISSKRTIDESDASAIEESLMSKTNDRRRRSRSISSKRTIDESDASAIEESLMSKTNDRRRRSRSIGSKKTINESDVSEIEGSLIEKMNDRRRRSRSKSLKRTINESDVCEIEGSLMEKMNDRRRRSRSKSLKRTINESDVSENDEALLNKMSEKRRRSRSKSLKRTVNESDVSENDEALMNKMIDKKRRSRSISSKRSINESDSNENVKASTNKMKDKRPHRSRSRTSKRSDIGRNTAMEVDEQNAQNKEKLSRDKRETLRKRRRSDLEEAVITIMIPTAEKRKKGEAVTDDKIDKSKDDKKPESSEKNSEKTVENESNKNDTAVNDKEVPTISKTTKEVDKEASISKSEKALGTSTPIKTKPRGRPRKTSTPKEQEKEMNYKQKPADKINQIEKERSDDRPILQTRASRSKTRSKSLNRSQMTEVIEKSVGGKNDKDNSTTTTIEKGIESTIIPSGTKENEAEKPVDIPISQTKTSKSKTRSKSLTRSQTTEVKEMSLDKTNNKDKLANNTKDKTNEPKIQPVSKHNAADKPVDKQNIPNNPTETLKVVDRLQFDDDTSLAVIAREVAKKNVSGLPTISSVRSLSAATLNTTTTTKTNTRTTEITVSANSATNVFTPTITDNVRNMKEAVDKLQRLRNDADSSKPLVGRVGVRSFARMTSPTAPLEKEKEAANKTVEVEVKTEPIDLDDPERRLEKIDRMRCFHLRPVNPVTTANLRDVRISKVVVAPVAAKAAAKTTEVRVRARKTFPSPRKDAEGRSELNGKNSMVYIPIQPPTTQAPAQRLTRPVTINGTANVQTIRPHAPVSIMNNTVNTQSATLSTSVQVTTSAAIVTAKPTNTVATNSHTKAICVPAVGQMPTIGHVPTVGQVPTTVHTVPLITSVNGQWTFSLQPMMSVGGDGAGSPPVVNGLPERSSQFIPVAPSNPLTLLPAGSLLPNNATNTTNSTTGESTPAELPRLQQRPPMVNPLDPSAPAGPVPAPSTAGPLTAKLSQNAVKLADFFRNLLEDTLERIDDPASQATALKLQLEQAKWRHQQEVNELKHAHELLTTEMRVAFEKEKTRAIGELRRVAQVELEAAVKAAKTKQWCANCSQEAQFYCCWNTSYCDYSCQRSHWSQHNSVCTQPRNTESNSNENGSSLDKRLPSGPENLPKNASAPALTVGTKITPTRVYAQAQAQEAGTPPQKTSIIVSMVEDPSGNQMVKCVGTYKPPGTQQLLLNKQSVTDENTAKKVMTSGGYLIVGGSNNATSVTNNRRNHPIQFTYNT